MVIISIQICTKAGKILLGRQYSNMEKVQIEENIKQFPKIIQENQQHTFIEINNLRFIYVPLEELYLILITSKQSNIIDDLETIRILNILVIDTCKDKIDEKEIINNAFDFLLIFDDFVSFGYRESVTQDQVHEYLKMQSNEENLNNLIKIAKENEAKENVKKFIREKALQHKVEISQPIEIKKEIVNQHKLQEQTVNLNTSQSKFSKKQGLSLGIKKVQQKNEKKDQQKAEFEEKIEKFNPLNATVSIEIIEQLQCQISKDGGILNYEIIGDILVRCNDQNNLRIGVELSELRVQNIQMKPHPNLNKQIWMTKNVLSSKAQQFAFSQNLSFMKYKLSQDQKQQPFTFNYWFNESSITMELEYIETKLMQKGLRDLVLKMQFPVSFSVESNENSDFKIENEVLFWNVPELNASQQNCNILVNFDEIINIESCFPISVIFEQEDIVSGLKVVNAFNFDDEQPVKFEFKTKLKTNEFYIV